MSRYATTRTECPICHALVYESAPSMWGVSRQTMYAHGPKGNRCPGSGKTVDEARAVRRS